MTPSTWAVVALVAQASFQQGVAHFREGRLAEAEQALLQSLSETPDHAPSSVRSDLRSTFRYGIGAAIAESLGIDVTHGARSIRDAWQGRGTV